MMATAVVADHSLDADERAYLNLGLDTVTISQHHWMVSSAPSCEEDSAIVSLTCRHAAPPPAPPPPFGINWPRERTFGERAATRRGSRSSAHV